MNPRIFAVSVLTSTLFYAISFGPAARAVSFGHLSLHTFLSIYSPFTGNNSFARGMQIYAKLWLPESRARESWMPVEGEGN
jgi:hypothetical protein